jgi:hypothetical protein
MVHPAPKRPTPQLGVQLVTDLSCCLLALQCTQELEVFAVSVYDISPLSCLTNLQELDLHQVRQQQQQQQR